MKREGLNIELNRGKLWIYLFSGYRHIIIIIIIIIIIVIVIIVIVNVR